MAPEGAASSSSQVIEGDLLLSVNGQDVQSRSPDEVRKLLAAHSSDPFITLGLRRLTMNGNQSNGSAHVPPELTVHSSTPETSPVAERKMKTRRTGAFSQTDKLPKIHEHFTVPNFPNLDLPPEKRLSLTPEMTRRSPVPLTVSKSLDLSNLPQWRQASKMVPLQNLLDNTELHDRLHNQQLKVGACATKTSSASVSCPQLHIRVCYDTCLSLSPTLENCHFVYMSSLSTNDRHFIAPVAIFLCFRYRLSGCSSYVGLCTHNIIQFLVFLYK